MMVRLIGIWQLGGQRHIVYQEWENWCRATMLLWFESYKVKLNKPKDQRGGFANK